MAEKLMIHTYAFTDHSRRHLTR
jgi:hypothetical protein